MMTRIITGACLVIMLAVALALGGWVFSILYMASICLSMYEVFRALGEAGHRPVQWPNWLCLLLSIPLFTMQHSVSYLMPLVAGACMLVSLVVMYRPEPRLEDLLVSVLPLFCVLLPGMCMLGLASQVDRARQLLLILMSFAVPLVGDMLAYFIGSRFGKRKLCPAVSYNKSVEGALAGLLGSVLSALALYGIFSAVMVGMPPIWHFLVLGVIGGMASQTGDLFASLIKRHCGIKDYGSIFPGHGGMMDRLDSVYWATVVMYVYLNLQPFK